MQSVRSPRFSEWTVTEHICMSEWHAPLFQLFHCTDTSSLSTLFYPFHFLSAFCSFLHWSLHFIMTYYHNAEAVNSQRDINNNSAEYISICFVLNLYHSISVSISATIYLPLMLELLWFSVHYSCCLSPASALMFLSNLALLTLSSGSDARWREKQLFFW